MRPVLAIYSFIFLVEVVLWAMVPLAPRFGEELGLSTIETAAILASMSAASIVVGVPAGVLTDRFGPRRLTVSGGLLTTFGTLGQGLAEDFWSLLGSRAVFGAGFSLAWTAGLVWLADSVGAARRARALGATITASGIAGLVAPVFAGLVAEQAGISTPFYVIAAGCAFVTAALIAAQDPDRATETREEALRHTLRVARREVLILGGLAATALGGLAAGAFNLLLPLQLHQNGLSEWAIGLLFSIGAGLFITTSALQARRGQRAVKLHTVVCGALGLALVTLVAIASEKTTAIAAVLLLRAPLLAALFTVSFPLAALGSRRAGIGPGAVLGLQNVLWGIVNLIGLLLGGAIAELMGGRVAFGMVLATAVLTATWAFWTSRARVAELPESVAVTGRGASGRTDR